MNWQDTQLMRAIRERENAENSKVRILLDAWMPKIQEILRAASTAPTDFTLHDERHSYRVAERMVEIIGVDKLQHIHEIDLSILLLSAYLHDIGMSPAQEKVSRHYRYLLSGDDHLLNNSERECFQTWLDDDAEGIVPPICQGIPTSNNIRDASWLTSSYCRHRHNDWSKEWIVSNTPEDSTLPYSGYIDDLIQICKSHHLYENDLMLDEYNPRLVNSRGDFIHPRFLACVLRLADVLDVDLERTPRVIFKHRDISDPSSVFWIKDHDISVRRDRNRYAFTARTKTAVLQKACHDTAELISQELAVCRRLADNTDFSHAPGITEPLPHCWGLAGTLHCDIRPRDNSYVYIDGSFRPNTEKLLELLSGVSLYKDRIVAVRELTQNAFDAVKEQIAYLRLASYRPADDRKARQINGLHRVDMRLEQYDERWWLSCTDNGVGMTKKIIKDYLLISGKSTRHQVLELERKCIASGFRLSRTGNFGIGVLSYFMIADRIQILTRRSIETGDSESHGWCFTTDGVGSFGELKSDNKAAHGTELRIRLRDDLFDNPSDWYNELRTYLADFLHYLPCEFQLSTSLPSGKPLSLAPGWNPTTIANQHVTHTMRSAFSSLRKSLPTIELPLADSNVKRKYKELDELESNTLQDALDCLTSKTVEGTTPNGLIRFRAIAIAFQIKGGISACYMNIGTTADGSLTMNRIGRGWAIRPKQRIRTSWKGVRADFGFNRLRHFNSSVNSMLHHISGVNHNLILEIDIIDNKAATLGVDRSGFSLTEEGRKELDFAVQASKDALKDLLAPPDKDSAYDILNTKSLDEGIIINRPKWPHIINKDDSSTEWRRITWPATISPPFRYLIIPETGTFQNKPITILRNLNTTTETASYEGELWCPDGCNPDCIAAYYDYRLFLVPVFRNNPYAQIRKTRPVINYSIFPPQWGALAAVIFTERAYTSKQLIILNRRNALSKIVTESAWKTAEELIAAKDPLLVNDTIMSSRAIAISFLIQFCSHNNAALWRGLIDRDSKWLQDLWTLCKGKSKTNGHLKLYIEDFSPDSRIRLINDNEWKVIESTNIGQAVLPKAAGQWCIDFGGKARHDLHIEKI